MRVFITGAAGLVGRRLVQALSARGDQPVALSRSARRAREVLGPAIETVEGDPGYPGPWTATAAACDAVVHLAGEPVLGKRWNAEVKKEILESRVLSTRTLTQTVAASETPPGVFLSASAVGYYGAVDWPTEVDETHPPGKDFLAEVCSAWESAAQLPPESTTRSAVVRIGIVLDTHGGALGRMLPMFRLGLGGPVASGRQAFPWIHIDDLVALFLWIIDTPAASGVFNGTAPGCVTNGDFSRRLGKALHRPALLPVPAFGLRLLFGDGAEFLITGQRVVPRRAVESGFSFQHPDVDEALRSLLAS